MDLNKAIKEFHNVKKFKTKKPDWRDIIECIDATRHAPMAGDIFTPRFVLVQDPEKIKIIAKATQQSFVENCHYLVVMCSELSKTKIHFGNASKEYIKSQSGATIQNFLLKLTEKKLSTTWVKLFDEGKIKTILKIPENLQVEAIFPIGYEFKKESGKRKLIDIDNILFYDEYNNKRMSEPNIAGIDTARPWW